MVGYEALQSLITSFWIPAFAGMTVVEAYYLL